MPQAESIPDLHYVTYRMGAARSPLRQLFLGPGHLAHKVPEFILHKHAASPNGVKAPPFPEGRCQKERDEGPHEAEGGVNAKNQDGLSLKR